MNKIYKKNEVSFAIICIVIYVVGTSICENMSQSLEIVKLPAMIFHLCFTFAILCWLKKNGLFEKYGLVKPAYKLYRAWFYLPLIFIACSGALFGLTQKYSVPETVFYIISMLCVGFLEEIIFRGFLFLGMEKNNTKAAIIVSSLTFGIGHIVNLLNGQDILETLLQIVFAVAVGFVLVILFYKGKSLLPCIIFHGVNNALGAVNDEEASARFFGGTEKELYISVAIAVVLCAVYGVAMWKTLSTKKSAEA